MKKFLLFCFVVLFPLGPANSAMTVGTSTPPTGTVILGDYVFGGKLIKLFKYPGAVAYDSIRKVVYVADTDAHRVLKIGEDGRVIDKWGKLDDAGRPVPGWGNGEFYRPEGVAVDLLGTVYVADKGNHRIQKFSRDGTFVGSFGPAYINEELGPMCCDPDIHRTDDVDFCRDGQLCSPGAVAVDYTGNIYVGDQTDHIQKFTRDGAFLSKWGGNGTGNGEFRRIGGIAADYTNHKVYVADANNCRIQIFSEAGAYLGVWESEFVGRVSEIVGHYEPVCSFDPTGFMYPEQLAVDSSGNVYITDRGNDRIKIMSPDGAVLATLGKVVETRRTTRTGEEKVEIRPASGLEQGAFNQPAGVSVNPTGDVLYVADKQNNRVQWFTKTMKPKQTLFQRVFGITPKR